MINFIKPRFCTKLGVQTFIHKQVKFSNSYFMKNIALFSGIMWILFALFSCSTKKATFVSKNYHALTSEYNILFHGKEFLKQGVSELKNKNESDFYRELSLEGIEFDDKVYLPGQSRSDYLSKSEEKAAKAVQKHSIEIRGTEHNRKMDEAMLLLGMSRYYDQRYLAAMDAFNYALDNYYDTDLRNELLLWKAKTLLKLGNTRSARKLFAQILGNPQVKPDTKAWAYAFIAESYREEQLTDTVAHFLSLAARSAKNKDLRNTLAFKSAQVWEKLNRPDSAIAMTDLILKNNHPEKFVIHTRLYRIHLTRHDTATHEKNLKLLKRYLNNYYFNRYYPDIHFRYGEIVEVRQDTPSAINHFSQAARSTNKSLKKLTYNKLADIYWNKKNYLYTGKYLDSMLTVMDKNTLDYLLVSQRRRSIDQIVKWEEVIQRNDSILNFIQLDSTEQVKRIEAHINKLRKQKEEKITSSLQKSDGQTFYFYNTEQVQNGKKQFKERWGERKLEDLWRLSNKYGTFEENEEEKITRNETNKPFQEKKPDSLQVEFYLKQLPKNSHQIDSLKKEIVQAHLYLGINYANDKFREYGLAKKNLEKVLNNPLVTSSQKAQAYYTLWKIYNKENYPDKARVYAEKMKTEFPENPFTQFILNPGKEKISSSEEFNNDFRQANQAYTKGQWTKALQLTRSHYKKHKNHPDAPKFLLLTAKISGKLYGIDAYIEQLNHLAELAPDTEYEKHAKELIKKLKFLKIKYAQTKDEFPYYIVHIIRDTSQINPLKQCLQKIFEEEKATDKQFFMDRYDEKTWFLVSGNYLSKESAGYILDKLRQRHNCPYPETFVISREKYINLQLTKKSIAELKK